VQLENKSEDKDDPKDSNDPCYSKAKERRGAGWGEERNQGPMGGVGRVDGVGMLC